MEQQRGANAHRRPAHRRQHRLGEGADATQKAEHRRVHGAGLGVQKVTNVIAGAENGFMALEHNGTYCRVGFGLRQRVRHAGVHGGGDGVFLVHPVQGDGQNTGAGVGQDVAHGRVPFSGAID